MIDFAADPDASVTGGEGAVLSLGSATLGTGSGPNRGSLSTSASKGAAPADGVGMDGGRAKATNASRPPPPPTAVGAEGALPATSETETAAPGGPPAEA